ncbi:MAG: phenylalanine--tRNA ligase subunit alpha [Phycisphaeraceae bacterium]|nr:phenylalanine--tRNA ligase subunit alpha [Phycisphaeraceae bacterium]
MLEELRALESNAIAELDSAGDPAALEAWRLAYLGPKGRLREAQGRFKAVPPAEKPAVGAKFNQVKAQLEERFASVKERVGAQSPRATGPILDPTEPGVISSGELGRRHIISRVREELVEVFARMGFEVAQGPELEDDEHNFIKLNIPPDHPARDPADNFYVDDPARTPRPRMLRSQTSTVQIRVMEAAVAVARQAAAAEGEDESAEALGLGAPGRAGRVGGLGGPIRIVAPGRVYRPDTVDATHSFMFHQIEGLAIDRGLTMSDLKSCLLQFAKAYFGAEAQVRLRPSYFPFTEPSAEIDMRIRLRPEQPLKWMELGGCGMVDPAVLELCGIDPEEWTGFAFGFGIERLAMGKYGIPDIRMLYENDLRFLRQV